MVCPVCREPISYDQEVVAQTSASSTDEEKYDLSPEIRQLQQNMAILFAKQKAKGGIIDVEAERNKFLIPQEGSVAI